MADTTNKRIVLGSGKLYIKEFSDSVPATTEICTDANLLGYIQGGATLEYKPSFYTAKDDLGVCTKTIITDEEATLKSGVMTFNADTLKKLSATGTVTTSGTTKTLKVGGIGNYDGKSYVLCFHHSDEIDGDIYVMIVGQNQAGFSLAFAKDKETVIDAEFKALSMDDNGTLIQYIEESPQNDG